MEKDSTYRKHILDSIADIKNFLEGISSYEEFVKNKLVCDAVIRKLEIIGEAAKRISPEYKNHAPQIPWKKIAGTRDKLIHDYMSVNLKIVWKILHDDIPQFENVLQKDMKA